MSPRINPSPEASALLEKMIVAMRGDDEQLWALLEGIEEGLDLPMNVHVVGEPLSLIAVDYDGNPRRGLTARCLRKNGTEHRVSFADIQLAPDAAGYIYLAAYCVWLGVQPAMQPAEVGPPIASEPQVRHSTASEEDIDLAQPIDLVVVAVKERAARCRLIGSERVITLRVGSLCDVVAGQVVTVRANKHWHLNGHPYLSGKIISARIDVAALQLTPLALIELGAWDPAEAYWVEGDQPIDDSAKPIIALRPRLVFEMEQVLPGRDPNDFDSDPILEANSLLHAGDTAGASDILGQLLEMDLRCLDAHAHLGDLLFRTSPERAINHYEVGVRIGELSLGADFDGVLPWGLIDNRPFLRCMQGYGLCLWRLQRWEEAVQVFKRLLWMNLSDNQGIRFLLPNVRARLAYVDNGD